MADRRSDDAPTLSVSYGQLQERKRHLKLTSHHHYHHNESSSDDTRSRPSPRSTSKDCSAGSSEGVSTRGENKKWLEWVSYEKRLERVCSRWAGSSDQLEQVLHICHVMEGMTRELLIESKEEVIVRLWKSCHYKIIERLRKFYKQSQTTVVKKGLAADIESFLSDSCQFYSSIIDLCQEIYQVDLLFKGDLSFESKTERNKFKTGVNIIHYCYLSIGDIMRYNEELKEEPDWSKPRAYYLKSRVLVPRDGKPYNQLAVISINSNRRFDAVYYYCRSLWVKNSFLSANDSLIGLFHETAKKLSHKVAKSPEMSSVTKTTPTKATPTKLDGLHSKEVWILPKEISAKETETEEPLDDTEVSKKLMNQFLFAHSKLFTKIGIDQFSSVLSDFIELFKSYLNINRDPSKLLKMLTINISTIHYTLHNKDDISQSVSFSLQFVNILIDSSCSLLLHFKEPVSIATVDGILDDKVLKDILNHLSLTVPVVRVWFNWVATHVKTWEALLVKKDISKLFYSFFDGLCSLINLTQFVLPLRLPIPDSSKLSCSKYWEDKVLAGFSCLTTLSNLSCEDIVTTPELSDLSQEQLLCQSLTRLSLLQFEVTSRSSLERFIFYDSSSNRLSVLYGLVSPQVTQARDHYTIIEEDEKEEEEEEEERVGEEREEDSKTVINDEGTEIESLKKEKDRLYQQLQEHEQQKTVVKSVIDQVINAESDEMIIKPHYLVPDTNCFINSLGLIKDLIQSNHFIIAIPTTVINELEGLSKDNDVSRSKLSCDALTYIKDQLSIVGNTRVKILTSQGNILVSLVTVTEAIDYKSSSNDDTILSSCVALHNQIDTLAHHCSVVLLTDDRNLKVKSIISHLPVRTIQQFVSMLSL